MSICTRLVVIGLLALLAGCGDSDSLSFPTTSAHDELPAIHVDGTTFRDAAGRQVILRGYNARVQGIFDVTFGDGRLPLETILPFNEDDAQRFETLGLNVLRLCVNWSGLEPQPLQYSEAYMQRVDAIVELGRRHHFYVLIDMHEDAYSKEIGEDGAPLWAIVPPPQILLGGPLMDLDARRVSPAALRAGASFFANRKVPDGRALQEAFGAAVQQLVKRYVDNPAVAGYEAFNEPIVQIDASLDAFHKRFADAVHLLDPQRPIFFEPSAFRNSNDFARIPDAPWANGPGVYAPHIYTTIFSPPNDGWASEDPSVLTASMEAAAHEATAWDTPLFVGEFGTDQTMERGHRWLQAELDLQDRFLASGTVWVWRETGYWGLLSGDGAERSLTVHTVSRPFPRVVAGDLLAIERPAPGHLRVRYRDNPDVTSRVHEVSVSTRHLSNYEIRCDGTAVVPVQLQGRAQFTCPPRSGERTFDVVGASAP